MEIQMCLISGFAIGLEYLNPEQLEEDCHCMVLDLGIFRFLCFWDAS